LARDPQGAPQLAERPACAEPARDLLAGTGLKLATQLSQRLERAQRIAGIGRLLSKTAKMLFGRGHFRS